MKLYTEEHLKLFYQLGKFDGIARRETDVEEEIKNHLPIELPSDEEILKNGIKPLHGLMDEWHKGFLFGAKLMHFLIQRGNNG